MDYANFVLAGLPTSSLDKLQKVQNWAAKVVLARSKYDISVEALKALHWLPVKYRIDFKILCIVYKSLRSMAPPYLSNLLKHRTFNRNTRLQTNSVMMLDIPMIKKKTHAERSFSVYGPQLWNLLPNHIKLSDNIDTFKKSLKTFSFKEAFKC